MKEEIWKPIDGFEGLYEISNFGRVKSLSRYQDTTKRTPQFIPERILSPADNRGGDGYLFVNLTKNKTRHHRYVHRLVAAAFVKNTSAEKNQINHKDGDKHNNVASNLEWCTNRENGLHRYNVLMKRNPYKGKEVSWNRKKIGLYENGDLSKVFGSLRECSSFLGKNYTWLSGVLHGRNKCLFDIRLL